MIKKDFIKIAEILSKVGYCINNNAKMINLNELVFELCEYFKSENPNFNQIKFKEACLK